MIDIEILSSEDSHTLNPIGFVPSLDLSDRYNSKKYEEIHKVYLKVIYPGDTFGELREMRLIINKLTGWNKPQIEQYLDNPYEIDLVLSEHDIIMTAHGLKNYCPKAKFYFIDNRAKGTKIKYIRNMNVTCIKSSKKLVKGATYKVAKLTNLSATTTRYFRPSILVYMSDNSFHPFPLNYFRPTSGGDFQQITWVCPDYQTLLNEREQTQINTSIKKGDYVVPKWDSLKTLVQGKKYKVTDVNIITHKNAYGSPSWSDIKLKLEGSSRFYASHNFRKCSSQEVREIGLNSLLKEHTGIEKVGKFKRKFDYLTEDEKKIVLLKHIMISSNDRFRHQMDLIDWTIDKSAKTYQLKREDFDILKDLNFTQILDSLK